jgi:hypothetical protein
MKKLRNDQQGFSAVEIILVVAVIVLLGLVGWMVHKNQNKTATAKTANTVKTKSTAQAAADPYKGWKTYTATLEPVSFRYPGDWTVATGDDAAVNRSDTQFVRLNAPQRSIDGVNYQFSLTFQIHNPTGEDQTFLPVYSSSKIADSSFPKTLYALTLENNVPASDASTDPNTGKAASIEVSATNYQTGSNTDGNDTIPTSTAGRNIDMGGSYVQVSNNTLAYFDPSQFVALQEVQQAVKIFGTLAQH